LILRLSNGVRVAIAPRPHAALVALKLFIKVGSRHDGNRPGLAHLAEHLMLHRPSRQRPIGEEVESRGGEINAVTHREYTALQAVVLPREARHALALFRDLLQPLEAAPDDLARERHVILREIDRAADTQPAVWDLFLAALWADDPFARPIYGEPAAIERVSGGELAAHFERYTSPERLVLAVAGPVIPEEVLAWAEDALGDLHGASWDDMFLHTTATPQRRRVAKETAIAHLIAGVEAVALGDPRRPAVKMLDMILGQGSSARLHGVLRGRWGLVYEIATAAMGFEDRGYFCTYTTCAPEHVGRVFELILEEFNRVKRAPVDGAELESARMRYEGMLARRFETMLSIASIIGIEELLHCAETFEQAVTRLRRVGAEDVRAVAQELIDLDRMAVALVGPGGVSVA
jgi:predicted Zn-dependent peptidase